ncbi:site-specific DNA-methyltransferase [Aeribacillus pallidus]|nr:site-specific DNA-methyltransferase [Aeribacillus pallidus]
MTCELKEYTILKGDCLDRLKKLSDNSIDSVVTDPPYGLSKEPDIVEVLTKWMNGEPYDHGHGGFMGKRWDSFVPHPDIWREVHRVLKPGGHALVFAGTRTQDLMTIALRLAGFEVRDVIEWLYFSGFPKSMDVSKAFDKRAGAEREVVAYGESGKILRANGQNERPYQQGKDRIEYAITAPATELAKKWDGWGTALKPAHEPIIVARKPLEGTVCGNVEKWGCGALNIDRCRIYTEEKLSYSSSKAVGVTPFGTGTTEQHEAGRFPANCVTTEPDAFWSKYCNVTPQELSKKASKRDRNSDWRGEPIDLEPKNNMRVNAPRKSEEEKFATKHANNHPTVKPIDLMAWLVRLVTPPGGTVLDPFAGSGSTLVAAKREGFGFIGIEREEDYVEIIEARTGEVAQ